MEITENTWILNEFKIEFRKGFIHEKTVDRYEGTVSFKNNEGERFTIITTKEISDKIMELIRPQILETANTLIYKLK